MLALPMLLHNDSLHTHLPSFVFTPINAMSPNTWWIQETWFELKSWKYLLMENFLYMISNYQINSQKLLQILKNKNVQNFAIHEIFNLVALRKCFTYLSVYEKRWILTYRQSLYCLKTINFKFCSKWPSGQIRFQKTVNNIHQVKSLHHHWPEFGLVTLRMKIGRKFPDPKTNFQGIFLVFLDAVKGIRNIISSKAGSNIISSVLKLVLALNITVFLN